VCALADRPVEDGRDSGRRDQPRVRPEGDADGIGLVGDPAAEPYERVVGRDLERLAADVTRRTASPRELAQLSSTCSIVSPGSFASRR
jgi:hypothetical protein